MKQKQGQAALEFLMTYGWAILAAVAVIGILGYYYFSSGTLTPSAAVVNAPFYLNAWAVSGGDDNVKLEIENNGAETYTVKNLTVSNCGYNDTETSVPTTGNVVFTVNCSDDLTEGETFQGDIAITYTKSGSTLELTSTGSITEKVV